MRVLTVVAVLALAACRGSSDPPVVAPSPPSLQGEWSWTGAASTAKAHCTESPVSMFLTAIDSVKFIGFTEGGIETCTNDSTHVATEASWPSFGLVGTVNPDSTVVLTMYLYGAAWTHEEGKLLDDAHMSGWFRGVARNYAGLWSAERVP